MNLDKIKKLLLAPHDQYLDADEALKLGLCDNVQDMDTFIPKTKKPRAKKKRSQSRHLILPNLRESA